ncbi:FAD-binding oxidoreductase [Microbacterium sp. NPDC077644]|uniref:FAD-binding oxidoreductase n=1 Tax=Microbacterium sp. NPDC077644 TaxID=3155055 RepID=UPI00344C2A52
MSDDRLSETLTTRPATAAEVAGLVRRAQQDSLPITVVAGGHGPWSHSPSPGMRIELTEIAGIEIDGLALDGEDAVVHIGGGAVWGDVAARLGADGLAISSGDTATVGVGGLTLGGGIGWMVRAWGLAADQLIGAQIVTAAGELVETSADEHPDLFWALRGGGGNFGIVTRFDFRAHPVSGIAFGDHVISTDATRVLRATRDLMREAPREVTVTYMDVPPMDPSAPAGARLSAVWAENDIDALRSVMAPIAALDGVEAEYTTPAYRDILLQMPEPAEGAEPPGFIGGNGLFAELDDDLIDRLVAFRAAYPASVVFLRSLGGAYGDVGQAETAFPARTATWFVMAGGFDIPGLVDDETRERIRDDWRAIETGRLAEYGNFADTERPDAVPGMFRAEAFERLREIKRAWDPQNVFARNHNIAP